MEFTFKLSDVTETSKVGKHWKILNERLLKHVQLNSNNEETLTSKSVLSFLGGLEVMKKVVSDFGPLQAWDNAKYCQILKQISEECLPRLLLLYERCKLATCVQEENECVCYFLSRLKNIGELCELGKRVQSIFKTHIINGVSHPDLRNLFGCSSDVDNGYLQEFLTYLQSPSCGAGLDCPKKFFEQSNVERANVLESCPGETVSNKKPDNVLSKVKVIRNPPCISKFVELNETYSDNKFQTEKQKTALCQDIHLVFSATSETNYDETVDRNQFQQSSIPLLERETEKQDKNAAINTIMQPFPALHLRSKLSKRYITRSASVSLSEGSNVNNKSLMTKGTQHGKFPKLCKTYDNTGNKKLLTEKSKKKSVCFGKETLSDQINVSKWEVQNENVCGTIEAQEISNDCIRKNETKELNPILSSSDKFKEPRLKLNCGPLQRKCILQSEKYPKHALLSHIKSDTLKCLLCPSRTSSFQNSSKLIDHIKHEHYSSTLKEDDKTNHHHRHMCLKCGESFRVRALLRDHHRKYHHGKTCFECRSCARHFKSAKVFARHSARCKGKSDTEYPCSFCGQLLNSRAKLERHERSVHTGDRPFTCKQCPASFIMKTDLTTHLKTHKSSRARNSQCHICGKTFLQSYYLPRHVQQHLELKKFNCHICSQRFTTAYGLKKHAWRKHDGDRPMKRWKSRMETDEEVSFHSTKSSTETAYPLGPSQGFVMATCEDQQQNDELSMLQTQSSGSVLDHRTVTLKPDTVSQTLPKHRSHHPLESCSHALSSHILSDLTTSHLTAASHSTPSLDVEESHFISSMPPPMNKFHATLETTLKQPQNQPDSLSALHSSFLPLLDASEPFSSLPLPSKSSHLSPLPSVSPMPSQPNTPFIVSTLLQELSPSSLSHFTSLQMQPPTLSPSDFPEGAPKLTFSD